MDLKRAMECVRADLESGPTVTFPMSTSES